MNRKIMTCGNVILVIGILPFIMGSQLSSPNYFMSQPNS